MAFKIFKFSATWCQPCKSLAATLSTIETKPEIVEIDIDQDMDTSMKYKVRSVPTLVKVDAEGNEISRKVGAMAKSDLEVWLNNES
jgi:thioredoxin 1